MTEIRRRDLLALLGAAPLLPAVALAANDTGSLQAAIDRLAAQGGGELHLEPRQYIANIQIGEGVRLIGSDATVIRPANNSTVVDLVGDRARLENVRINATHPADNRRPLGLHGVRVQGSGCETRNCQAEGARFDSLYIRLRNSRYTDVAGRWLPSGRNSASIVNGHGIEFRGSLFQEAKGTYDARSVGSFDGVYVFDIEPNKGESVYDVSLRDCTFERLRPNPNSGVVIAYSRGGRPGPDGRANVALINTTFRGPGVSLRIKDHTTGVVRGISIIGANASGFLMANPPKDQTRLEDSIIRDVTAGAGLTSGIAIGATVIVNNIR